LTSEQLIKLREEHGLSQEEFAQKIGYKRRMVIYWEKGVYPIPFRANLAMMQVFGVNHEKA
jgi:transcriptional regulator with XRE-family HTH domain